MTEGMTTAPLVSMRGISKSFVGIEVLHHVDFSVRAGEIHGLVGHNGAGKSTLMNVLGGVFPDYTGEVSLNGEPRRLTSPLASLDAGISVVHQEFSLIPEFTVPQNLALGREPRTAFGALRKREALDQCRALLDDLGFPLPLDQPVRRMSVGAQQLTEIAKAVGGQARVLVMDEPTARLAPREREALFAVIRQLSGRGVGIVYISHFLEEVLEISDAITVLRDGSVIAQAPASQFSLGELSRAVAGQAASDADAHAGAPSTAVQDAIALEIRDFGASDRPGSTLSVHAGEIVGLAGLVGSGRTSLAQAICGARTSHGALAVGGRPCRFSSPAKAAESGVVMVPEDRKTQGLVLTSPVSENITLTALGRLFTRLGFVEAGKQRQAVAQSVTRFNILGADAGKALAKSLSGGNQQKVLIARVALARPTLLILDQPTAGVDIGAKGEIYDHIRELARSGVACLVLSDELEELLGLTDRIAIVRSGRVHTVLPTEELDPGNLLELMSVK